MLGLATLATAACTGGSDSGTTSTAPPSTASSVGATTTGPSLPTGTPTAVTSTVTVAPPPSPPASSPASNLRACTTLTVIAERVPGATGRTFGLLTFVNAAGSTCTVTGRPGAVLLDASGTAMTAPAVDEDGPSDAITLTPGAAASTLLVDDSSTCNANSRSTSVRVTAPGTTTTHDLPLALPPCALSLKPVVAGTEPTP